MTIEIHNHAICGSKNIGEDTRIGAFSEVCEGAILGKCCEIASNVFIGGGVVLGERVRVQSGARLCDGVTIEDDATVGPNAALALGGPAPGGPEIRVGREATVGANSTVLPGVSIGRRAVVTAGSVVTLNVPPFAVVSGNPARITAYLDSLLTPTGPAAEGQTAPKVSSVRQLSVGGASLHRFPTFEDARGRLSVGNFSGDIPFKAERFYLTYEVPSRFVRGEHAHRTCKQFLICVAGSLRLVLDDASVREEITLDNPNLGVYIPPMVWASEYGYSADTVLLVFASHLYDPDDYIRVYEDFLAAAGKG